MHLFKSLSVRTWLELTAALVVAVWLFARPNPLKQPLAALQAAYSHQVQVNDSTAAQLASTRLQRDSLRGVVTAAQHEHGTVVGGVAFTVVKHDTVWKHDSLPTVMHPDSTRVATFHDSTFAGTLDGQVTAPPCCAPLQARFHLTRPQFRPEVGFVQLADGVVVANVVWQGEHVQVDAPFYKPVAKHQPWVSPWVEGTYFLTGGVRVSAGAALTHWGLDLGPAADLTLQNNKLGADLGVSVRKRF